MFMKFGTGVGLLLTGATAMVASAAVAAQPCETHFYPAAKLALGERGDPWWDDGAPDFNRYLAKNTPYADWYAALGDDS